MERQAFSPTPTTKWNAAGVIKALTHHYLHDIWSAVSLREIELEPHHEDEKYCRRADMLTIFCNGIPRNTRLAKDRIWSQWHERPWRSFPSGWRIGWEIKTNKNDLLLDIKQKHKQTPLQKLTNEMYLVLPKGIIQWNSHELFHYSEYSDPEKRIELRPDIDIPQHWGIIEVYYDQRSRWKGIPRAKLMRQGAINYNPELPVWFLSRLLLSGNQTLHYGENEKS